MLALSWIRFLIWPTAWFQKHQCQQEGEGRAPGGKGHMSRHQSPLPLVVSFCETSTHVLPACVSRHTSHDSVTRTSCWPGAQVTQLSWCVCREPCGPAQGTYWKWLTVDRRGRTGPFLSGWQWVRTGVVWNWTRTKARIKAPAQGPHVRHKQAFNDLPWGWDRSNLPNTSADINLCAVAGSPLPIRYAHARTQTHTQWLLCWCGKTLHGELHTPECSSVCV